MTIFGVDPGTICTGYGIISFNGNIIADISSGIIKPSKTMNLGEKLAFIYDELCRLIKAYSPDQLSIETAFYGKNVQSAMKIGYVRGVALLASVHNNIPACEYSPREIKKSVVGNGAASKEQVQYMIRKLLNIPKTKIKFDETDALAAAVCHAFNLDSIAAKKSSWKEFVKANPDRIISS
jgi:crossover junction endodeoxyribonuclease RuvC